VVVGYAVAHGPQIREGEFRNFLQERTSRAVASLASRIFCSALAPAQAAQVVAFVLAALRNVVNRLIGCLYHCLQTGQTYDETTAFPTQSAAPESAAA
jgi:hypothetical protein